jgi:hypothetical protein
LPHTLVDESPERVALYCPPGTRGRRPRRAFVDYIGQLRTGHWEIVEHVWARNHVLRLTPFGAAHSVDLYWAEHDWAFRGWYVNLQEPLRRTSIGFDTRDQALDIVVEPDGSWSWKDEDHLAQLVRDGVWAAADAEAIRSEGERVLGDPPWPTGWEDWRPDPAWPLPSLPVDWETAP